MILWVDSNHLPPELQASALTTHPLNSYELKNVKTVNENTTKFNVHNYLDYNDDALDPNNEAEEAGRTAADIEVGHADR